MNNVQQTTFVLIMVLVLVMQTTDGHSTGPPNSACGNQIPQHSDNPRLDSGGYEIRFLDASQYTSRRYGGPVSYRVQIEASITGYRGFMMSAYSPTRLRTGGWTLGSNQKVVCGAALAHSNPDLKQTTTYFWNPPSTPLTALGGTMSFETSLVRDFSTIYLRTRSVTETVFGGTNAGLVVNQNGTLFQKCSAVAFYNSTFPNATVWINRANGDCDFGTSQCSNGLLWFSFQNETFAEACTQTPRSIVCNNRGDIDGSYFVGRSFNDFADLPACTCDEDWMGSTCSQSCPGGDCGVICPTGYASNNTLNCTDVNECLTRNGGCDPLVLCTNTPGNRTCGTCPAGYTGDGYAGCVDINECLVSNGGCDPASICSNTPGNRTCGDCTMGFDGSGYTTCTPCGIGRYGNAPNHCTDCRQGTFGNVTGLTACHVCRGTFYTPGPGFTSCEQCDTGYTGNSTRDGCVDINDCSTNNGGCDVLAVCTNTPGNRTCGACPSGFTGDGYSGCTDINECLSNNGGCSRGPLVSCTNTAGSRTCGACPSGYTGSGLANCTDVNECLSNNGGCDLRTTCTNTRGNRTCGACPAGFTGNGYRGCSDINECLETSTQCGSEDGFCANVVGTFVCATLTSPSRRRRLLSIANGTDGLVTDPSLTWPSSVCTPETLEDLPCTPALPLFVCESLPCNPADHPGQVLAFVDPCVGVTCTDNTTVCQTLQYFTIDGTNTKLLPENATSNIQLNLQAFCAPPNTTINVIPGAGSITCLAGYDNANNCTDSNECETDNGGCDSHAECINQAGSFACGPCPDGFSGTAETECVEIIPSSTATSGATGSVSSSSSSSTGTNGNSSSSSSSTASSTGKASVAENSPWTSPVAVIGLIAGSFVVLAVLYHFIFRPMLYSPTAQGYLRTRSETEMA